MSRARDERTRCKGITMATMPKYARRCYNRKTAGSDFCVFHGDRPARLIVKQGRRRDFVEISCEHLTYLVKFNSSEKARLDWTREVLRMTSPHKCFAKLRQRYA